MALDTTSPGADGPPAPIVPLGDERAERIDVGGLKLCVRHWGMPEAPPLVLLHGLRGYSGTWRILATALGDRYHLIALDQRGRGNSDWDGARNYYTQSYVEDLEAVVDRLGLGRFALLGHSMGGTAAYVYAERHPARLQALIVEDIAPGSSTTGEGAQRIVAEMAGLPESFASWREARAYWRTKRPTLGEQAIEERLGESMREDGNGRILWRYDAAGIRATRMNPDATRVVDLWPIVQRIAVPTLVIRGASSDFCPLGTVEDMSARNPLIRSVTVPDASHYVHDDAPGAFNRHVRDFLEPLLEADGAAHDNNAQRSNRL